MSDTVIRCGDLERPASFVSVFGKATLPAKFMAEAEPGATAVDVIWRALVEAILVMGEYIPSDMMQLGMTEDDKALRADLCDWIFDRAERDFDFNALCDEIEGVLRSAMGISPKGALN